MKKLMCNLLACASLASVGGVVASASETNLPFPDMESMANEWLETGEELYANVLENYGAMALYNEGMKSLKNNDFERVEAIIFELNSKYEIDLANSLNKAMIGRLNQLRALNNKINTSIGKGRNLLQEFDQLNDDFK